MTADQPDNPRAAEALMGQTPGDTPRIANLEKQFGATTRNDPDPTTISTPSGSSARSHTLPDDHPVPAYQSDYSTLQIGTEVFGYRLIRLLGRGGMGVTWLAQRDREAEPVALKMLPSGLLSDTEEAERVRKVFNLVKSLRHPNVAMIFQLAEDSQRGPLLIMEYVRGVTLRQFQLNRGPGHEALTIDQVVAILEPVAAALDYAHAMRVIHRDIKPSNIMLSDMGQDVRLIDFGLGDEIRQSMANASLRYAPIGGTAPYMPPEQWRGHLPTPESDQYALACVAYELLTGHPPFVSADMDVLRQCHIYEPVAIPSGLSSELAAPLWRQSPSPTHPAALAKQRAHRFRSCAAFIHALREAAMRRNAPKCTQTGRGYDDFPVYSCPEQRGIPADGRFADCQSACASVFGIPRILELDLDISMVLIPPGTFRFGIGSPDFVDESGYRRPRNVAIEQPFYLARWPVTRGTWKMVLGDTYRSRFGVQQWYMSLLRLANRLRRAGSTNERRNDSRLPPDVNASIDLPVDSASWSAVALFLDAMNTMKRARNPEFLRSWQLHYRIPTEAEWEYACRAGGTTRYSNGDHLDELSKHAWFRENTGGKVKITAMLTPNSANLHDMLGNVWEWCDAMVLRGGSCRTPAASLTSNLRSHCPSGSINDFTGIRVAASILPLENPVSPADEFQTDKT